jgi:hypothetical protein
MRCRRCCTLAGAFLALLLAGCSGISGTTGKLACPAAFTAPNLESYTVYKPGVTPSTNAEDIIFGAKIVTVTSNCKVEPGGIRVTTSLTFAVARNDPELRQSDFTYFVAIADAQQTILAKQNFALRVDFSTRQKQMRIMDQITEHLPLKDISTGSRYAVIVGMQVSQQQLELNRLR